MQAASKTLIPEKEYLSECYEPDCDYVDGRVEERNLGERDHAWLQTLVVGYFMARRKEWDVMPMVELRILVKPKRYRVADVCVVLGKTDEQILTKPPFICIEVLSPEDRWSRVKARVQDFLDMGVPHVWVLDPQTRQAFTLTAANGLCEVKSGILRTESPTFEVPLADLFE
jgi:Uma2 family endonuclease